VPITFLLFIQDAIVHQQLGVPMPICRDASGHSVYVSPTGFYREKPEDILSSDEELETRIKRARMRVLEVIRYTSISLRGRGLCHEIPMNSVGSYVEELASYVDFIDGRRAKQVRKQRTRAASGKLGPGERRLRSPQDVKKRRSALFSGKDIPVGYFGQRTPSTAEVSRFVDQMRWHLFEAAIRKMQSEHELVLVGRMWHVPVSVMDVHRLRPIRQQNVKVDDRSFHGRPNRDRRALAAA
jgi:hypothetical protein